MPPVNTNVDIINRFISFQKILNIHVINYLIIVQAVEENRHFLLLVDAVEVDSLEVLKSR